MTIHLIEELRAPSGTDNGLVGVHREEARVCIGSTTHATTPRGQLQLIDNL